MSESFEYEVGDSFEGGPIELQKYISKILAVGGTFDYEGSVVTLTSLPWDNKAVDEVVAKTIAAIEEEDLSPAEDLAPIEEAIVEEDLGGTDLGTAEIGDKVADPEVAIAPAPKPRGRKPAVKVIVDPTE